MIKKPIVVLSLAFGLGSVSVHAEDTKKEEVKQEIKAESATSAPALPAASSEAPVAEDKTKKKLAKRSKKVEKEVSATGEAAKLQSEKKVEEVKAIEKK